MSGGLFDGNVFFKGETSSGNASAVAVPVLVGANMSSKAP